MQSGSARIGICTNEGILCPVILDALASAPIRVELHTTVLHVLASDPIRGHYAQWTCMSCRLCQLVRCMHSGPERLGVCTNQGGQYALCCCTCWSLHQSGGSMHNDPGRLGVCTNQTALHSGCCQIAVCSPICVTVNKIESLAEARTQL